MSVATFNEYSNTLDDKILRDFLLESGLNEEELKEFWSLLPRLAGGAATGVRVMLWNRATKGALRGVFYVGIIPTTIIGSVAGLAAMLCAWLSLDMETCAMLAKAIYYVGITVVGAFMALMGRRAALKFINWANKNKINIQVKNLQKKQKLTKADIKTIEKIAKKYNTKETLDKKALEKFKKKVA